LLLGYQNLCLKCTQWLRRDAGASFRGRGWKGLRTPQRLTILVFFRVNRTFETVLLLQQQYIMQI